MALSSNELDISKAIEPLVQVINLLGALQELDANFPVAGIRAVFVLAIKEASGLAPPTVRELGDYLTTKRADGKDERSKGLDRHSSARLVRSLSTGDGKVGIKGGAGLLETIDDPKDKRVKRVRVSKQGWTYLSEHFGLQPWPQSSKSRLTISGTKQQ